jgi:hypothetical protein
VVSHVAVDGAPVPGTDEVTKSMHDILFELVDAAVTNFSAGLSSPSPSLSLDSRNSLQADQNTGASVCMYDHGLGSLNGKPLKEVDPSQPFIEIRKNGEACTSGDTCSTPDQLSLSGVESGFCGRFGYEEAWNRPRTGDHVGHGPCSPSPETTSSSPSSKVMQDQWPRYQVQSNFLDSLNFIDGQTCLKFFLLNLVILSIVFDFPVPHSIFSYFDLTPSLRFIQRKSPSKDLVGDHLVMSLLMYGVCTRGKEAVSDAAFNLCHAYAAELISYLSSYMIFLTLLRCAFVHQG